MPRRSEVPIRVQTRWGHVQRPMLPGWSTEQGDLLPAFANRALADEVLPGRHRSERVAQRVREAVTAIDVLSSRAGASKRSVLSSSEDQSRGDALCLSA